MATWRHFAQAEPGMAAHWVNVGQPGTYPVRRTWVAP
jgi:hypothetical protein